MTKARHTTVTMSELRDNLSGYLDDAQRGMVITVTRRGKPRATLSAAKDLPEPIDLGGLEQFRHELGVHSESSVIVELRAEDRY